MRSGTATALRVLTAAALLCSTTILGACARSTPVSGTEPTRTAGPAPSRPTTTAPRPSTGATPTTGAYRDGTHFGYIRGIKMSGKDYILVLDIAQLYTGQAAYNEGKKDGQPVDNDYYIRNSSAKLRAMATAGDIPFITYTDTPSKRLTYTVADFYKMATSKKTADDFPEMSKEWYVYGQVQAKGADASPFYLTVKDGRVTKIEFFWTP